MRVISVPPLARDNFCLPLPAFQLMFLGRVYCPAHHLENVRWSAPVAVLHAYGDADDYASAKFPGGVRRNRCDKTAVGQTPRADLHRFEQTGESATRPDGVHQIALREYHGLTGGEVRSHHR